MQNKNLIYLGLAITAYFMLFQKKTIGALKIPYTQLSPYTIAKNCTDINDCVFGVSELKNFIRINYPLETKLAYKRLNALYKKIELLKTK